MKLLGLDLYRVMNAKAGITYCAGEFYEPWMTKIFHTLTSTRIASS